MKDSYLIKYVLWRTFPSVYSQGDRKFNLPVWIVKELLTMLLHKRLSMVLDSQSNGKTNTKSKKIAECMIPATLTHQLQSYISQAKQFAETDFYSYQWTNINIIMKNIELLFYSWILTLFSLFVLFESHFSALTSVSLHSGQREMRIFFASSGLSDAMITEDALETVLCFLM